MRAAFASVAVGSIYTLRSELYRSSLPQAAEDAGRRLIWMNTVCALFLASGVFGIAHPPGLALQKFTAEDVVQPVEVREFKQETQQQVLTEEELPPMSLLRPNRCLCPRSWWHRPMPMSRSLSK